MTNQIKEIFRKGDSVKPGDVVYLPVVFGDGGARFGARSESLPLCPLRVVSVGMFGFPDCFIAEQEHSGEPVGIAFFLHDLIGREVVRGGQVQLGNWILAQDSAWDQEAGAFNIDRLCKLFFEEFQVADASLWERQIAVEAHLAKHKRNQ